MKCVICKQDETFPQETTVTLQRGESTVVKKAVAAGVDGVFLEVHPDPDQALCDGQNSLALSDLPDLLRVLLELHALVNRTPAG